MCAVWVTISYVAIFAQLIFLNVESVQTDLSVHNALFLELLFMSEFPLHFLDKYYLMLSNVKTFIVGATLLARRASSVTSCRSFALAK